MYASSCVLSARLLLHMGHISHMGHMGHIRHMGHMGHVGHISHMAPALLPFANAFPLRMTRPISAYHIRQVSGETQLPY